MTEPATTVLLGAPTAEARLPGEFREEMMTQATEESLPRRWVAVEDGATVMLLIAPRNLLPGFGIPPYSLRERGLCTTSVAGARARVNLFDAVRSAPADTLYTATVDAELGPGQVYYAAVVARSPARRDALLGAVRALRPLALP